MTRTSNRALYHVPLILIVGIGLFLRLYSVGTKSLWNDESMSVYLSHQTAAQIVENRANDNHVPLYFVFLRYWVMVFGDSETSVRLPSVLIGTLAVYLAYRLARRIADRQTALISALILSLSLLNVLHAREARMYSLMVALVLLSMQAFLRLQEKPGTRIALAYLLPSILLLYTQLYALFFIAAQNAFILYQLAFRRTRAVSIRFWLLLQGILVLFFLPWTFVLVGQLRRRELDEAGNWIQAPTLDHLVRTFGVFSSSFLPLFLLFMLLCLLALGVLLTRRHLARVGPIGHLLEDGVRLDGGTSLQPVDLAVFLLLWLLLPVLMPFLLSHVMSPLYSPRYAIAATPALFLLVAIGLRQVRTRFARGVLVGAIVVLSVIPLVSYYRYTLNTPYYREATTYINQQARDGELVLVNGSQRGHGLYDYYPLRAGLRVVGYPPTGWSLEDATELVRQAEGERLWIMLTAMGNRTAILTMIEKSYSLAERWECQHGLRLLCYEKRRSP